MALTFPSRRAVFYQLLPELFSIRDANALYKLVLSSVTYFTEAESSIAPTLLAIWNVGSGNLEGSPTPTQLSKWPFCVRSVHKPTVDVVNPSSKWPLLISIQLTRPFHFFSSDILRPHGVALRAPPRLLGRPKEHRPPPHPDDGNHRVREGGPGRTTWFIASQLWLIILWDFNPLEKFKYLSISYQSSELRP